MIRRLCWFSLFLLMIYITYTNSIEPLYLLAVFYNTIDGEWLNSVVEAVFTLLGVIAPIFFAGMAFAFIFYPKKRKQDEKRSPTS